jgi:hypothetical protein
LYMAGSILILFAAYLFGAVLVLLLSRNPLLAVMLTALSVFSGVYVTWPRVSFAAIALLALGIPFALHFRRFSDKAAILVVIAFLVTFIRPEYISSLYLMSIIATASFLAALGKELKGGLGYSGVLPASLRLPLLSRCDNGPFHRLDLPDPKGRYARLHRIRAALCLALHQ